MASLKQLTLRGIDGATIAGADVDGLVAVLTPVPGSIQTATLLAPSGVAGKEGVMDWARRPEVNITISTGVQTTVEWYLTGTNLADEVIMETLTTAGAPITSTTIRATKAFKTITSATYQVIGTVVGDTMSLGWPDDGVVGLPPEITAATQVVGIAVSGGAGLDEGTFSVSTEDSIPMWTLEAPNKPDGVLTFTLDYIS